MLIRVLAMLQSTIMCKETLHIWHARLVLIVLMQPKLVIGWITQQQVAFNRSLLSILRGLDTKYKYVF